MAANKPMAVAISASAMPGATMASVACCTLPSASEGTHDAPDRAEQAHVGTGRADWWRALARLLLEPLDFAAAVRRASRGVRLPATASGGMPPCLRRRELAKPELEDARHAGGAAAALDLAIQRGRSPPFQKLSSKRSASSCGASTAATRLRKMMVQDNSDASISRPMTTCTIGTRVQNQPDDRQFIVHYSPLASHSRADEIGQGRGQNVLASTQTTRTSPVGQQRGHVPLVTREIC